MYIGHQRQVGRVLRQLPRYFPFSCPNKTFFFTLFLLLPFFRLLQCRTSVNDIDNFLPSLEALGKDEEYQEMKNFWQGELPDYDVEGGEFIKVKL